MSHDKKLDYGPILDSHLSMVKSPSQSLLYCKYSTLFYFKIYQRIIWNSSLLGKSLLDFVSSDVKLYKWYYYNRPVARGRGKAGGLGGLPQFLADQLTLSQPGGGAHSPHTVLQAPPDFQTLRRPCIICTLQYR